MARRASEEETQMDAQGVPAAVVATVPPHTLKTALLGTLNLLAAVGNAMTA
jgi:hypothetical protein